MTGIAAAVAVGLAMPLLLILMGDIIQEMTVQIASHSHSKTQGQNLTLHIIDQEAEQVVLDAFEDQVSEICKKMAVIATATFVAGYIQVFFYKINLFVQRKHVYLNTFELNQF